MKTKLILIIISFISVALVTGCHTDEMCYEHPHGASVTLSYDWGEAPGANPEGMRIWLYPQDNENGEPQLRDLPGTSGGEISGFVEGRYHIISHNNDTEYVTYRDREIHGAHTATTRDTDILEPLTRSGDISSRGIRSDEDERVAVTPDPLWLANSPDVDISDGGRITLAMKEVHCRYTYEFINMERLGSVEAVSASISGMSSGIKLADGSHTGEVCTHPLQAGIDLEGNRIHGEFLSFGYPEESAAPHRMGLYVIMRDGQKIKFTEGDNLDVTEQVRNASDRRNVHIVVDGLQLPALTIGGGFDPSVGDWEEEDYNIDI